MNKIYFLIHVELAFGLLLFQKKKKMYTKFFILQMFYRLMEKISFSNGNYLQRKTRDVI